jgi:SAM-dependent methyltransferase
VKSSLRGYYRTRAREYDLFYRLPGHTSDLARLADWLMLHVGGQSVLEVAAGTGYWTDVAARVAQSVTATDCNVATLAIAAKRCAGRRVAFLAADAYDLPRFDSPFDVGMASLWFSHVPRQARKQFLLHFASRLRSNSHLLMMDQNYVPGFSHNASRWDQHGNRYEIRSLRSGRKFEILKNYPTVRELRHSLEAVSGDLRVLRLRYFWAVCAIVRARAT